MSRLTRYFTALLLTSVVAVGAAGAADQTSATEKDPLKATLMESKEKNRGVTIHANGASIPCIVTSVDEHYVIGRSNQASRVVIRLDRIDGVSAMF